MFLIASSCRGTLNVYHHSCQHYTGSRVGDREKAPTVHLALTLQLQGQSISSSLIHSLNTENGEKKWASDPRGWGKKNKNPTHTMKDRQNLNNPSFLKQSYELHFLCSTIHIHCRKGKVRGSQLHLWATELLHWPSLQAAAEKKKLVRFRI